MFFRWWNAHEKLSICEKIIDNSPQREYIFYMKLIETFKLKFSNIHILCQLVRYTYTYKMVEKPAESCRTNVIIAYNVSYRRY